MSAFMERRAVQVEHETGLAIRRLLAAGERPPVELWDLHRLAWRRCIETRERSETDQ